MKKILLAILFVSLFATSSFAQRPIGGGSGSGGTLTSDADDASIAAAQTNSNVNSLSNVFDGTVWRRLTLYANDATAAGTTFLPTLVGLVETSAPTRTNGRMSGMSFFAGGGARVVLTNAAGVEQTLAQDKVDEAAFTYATSTVTAIGAVAESTTDTLADNTIGAPVMTLRRALRSTSTGYLDGGGAPVNMLSDASDNEDETAICTGPCTVYSIVAFNHTAVSAFLRCENDTSGNTTPGSETASDGEFDLEIPADATSPGGFVYNPGAGIGASFSTALTCWIVSDEASSGTTDVAANDVRAQFVRVQ